MNQSYRQQKEKFENEIATLRVEIGLHQAALDDKPMVRKQLEFWMQSAAFAMLELKIWDDLGNVQKCEKALARLENITERLMTLAEDLYED
jgi:hypothetical protein